MEIPCINFGVAKATPLTVSASCDHRHIGKGDINVPDANLASALRDALGLANSDQFNLAPLFKS